MYQFFNIFYNLLKICPNFQFPSMNFYTLSLFDFNFTFFDTIFIFYLYFSFVTCSGLFGPVPCNGYPKLSKIIQNYPKSFFGNHLTSWPGFDPRYGKFLFFTFLFNLTQLELRIIPLQKIHQNIKNSLKK